MITKTFTMENGAPIQFGKITSISLNPTTLRLMAILSLYVDSAHLSSNKPIEVLTINSVISEDQSKQNLIALAESLAIAKFKYLQGAIQS